jgi:tryptophan synthase beta chain
MTHSAVPDVRGRFGPYGGRFVPETLIFALEQLDSAYREAKADARFQAEFHNLLNEYVGRPSRLRRPAARAST